MYAQLISTLIRNNINISLIIQIMLKYTILSILFSTVLFQSSFSQPTISANDSRLAYEYYKNKEYDKAEIFFEKIYKKTNAKIYFQYYANCLIEQKKYSEAEKQIKKQIRKFKKDLSYFADLGYLYKKQDELEKATKQFEKAVNNITNMNPQIVSLANSFIRYREYDYAVSTYIKARNITGSPYHRELANIYAIQRKFPEMINQYLDMLSINQGNLKLVQNRMQYYITKDINDEFSDILRVELLKKIQGKNSRIIYNQMLIWLYMQKKEFKKALFQAKAIDKRINSSGKGIIDLAETALSNDDFETALSAYLYIINKGNNRAYFVTAKIGRLGVLYKKVINKGIKTDEEITALEQEYLTTINQLGINFNTIMSIINLAHIQAFYLDKPDSAKALLEDAIKIVGLPRHLIALCKIELGDILVYQNDLDLSALIYGQAEKDNKGNQYGDIAKLRKAKLAYYKNDFRWAKAQFDALKASTSKPVANDALFYSMLINDNTQDDSLMVAMKTFSRADLLIFQNKNDKALLTLDTIIDNHKAHQIIDETYLKKAEIYEKEKMYNEALQYLKKIITERNWDILADVAVYKIALIYDEKLQQKDEAAEFYKKLMLEYPDSIYVTDSRRRFREIRNSQQ